jgi:hypothetical protein
VVGRVPGAEEGQTGCRGVNRLLPIEKLRKHMVPFAGVAGFSKRKNFVCKRVCLARTRRPGACGGVVELRTGAAVPPRGAGALIGPDGRAVRWTHIGSARFAAACPTACRSGDRPRANHVHAATDKEGPSASHEWSARRWYLRRSGSDGRTRGPAYPEIDIGASQTDSALMRGTVVGEGPARPRRCQCPRVKRIPTLCSVFV